MEDVTTNSLSYLAYTYLFESLGECIFFNLGVKGFQALHFIWRTNYHWTETNGVRRAVDFAMNIPCYAIPSWENKPM